MSRQIRLQIYLFLGAAALSIAVWVAISEHHATSPGDRLLRHEDEWKEKLKPVLSMPPAASSVGAKKVPAQDDPKSFLDTDMASFAARYPLLAKKAEAGDASAARELYTNISVCDGAPRSKAEVDDVVEQIEKQKGATSKAYRAAVDFQNRRYENCANLSDDQLAQYRQWLSLAAKLGDARAHLDYVTNGMPRDEHSGHYYKDVEEYSANAKQYLDDELAEGNEDALLTASLAYGGGSAFRTDKASQYAYLFAYVKAKGIEGGVIFDRLALLAADMSATDLTAAATHGEAIYSEIKRSAGGTKQAAH